MFKFLFLCITAAAAVRIQVLFADTIEPNEAKNFMVCEAVRTTFGNNVTACEDTDPASMRRSMNYLLQTENVDIDNETVTIREEQRLQTQEYLENAGYFDFEEGRITIMVEMAYLQEIAYSVTPVYVVLMVVLTGIITTISLKSGN